MNIKKLSLLFKLDFYIIVLIFSVIFVLFVRIRLLEIPLERDEGEYAYLGQLICKGVPPYLTVANMKLPGVYLMYAFVFTLFGQSIIAVHLGLLCINFLAAFGIHRILKFLYKTPIAHLATSVFLILTLSHTVLGFASHATHFVIVFAIWGLYFFVTAKDKLFRYFLSGFFFALCILMKQHGVFLLFPLLTILIPTPEKYSRIFIKIGTIILGFLIPFIFTFAWIYFYSNFNNFWFWTVEYAQHYASQVPINLIPYALEQGINPVIKSYRWFWWVATAGFFYQLILIIRNRKAQIMILWTIGSMLSILPGFIFRPHYFITLLPAVAMLFAITYQPINEWIMDKINYNFLKPILYLLLIGYIAFIIERYSFYFIYRTPNEISLISYSNQDIFPIKKQIADSLIKIANTTDTLAVFGSEPQLYFHTKLTTTVPLLYLYPLEENHPYNFEMQNQLIHKIETSKPKWIVDCAKGNYWKTDQTGNKKLLYEWFQEFALKNYNLIGIYYRETKPLIPNIETLFEHPQIVSNWNNPSLPTSRDYYIAIYKRKF